MFKKIGEWIKTIGISLAGNAGINEVEHLLDKGLENFIVSDPEACKGLVIGLHAFIPTLAKLAAKTTGTDLDDKGVEETRKELEDFATRHNFDWVRMKAVGGMVGDAGANPPNNIDA